MASPSAQLGGTYACVKPKVYVPDCGTLMLVLDVGLGTFAITSADGALDDRGKFTVTDGQIKLTISGAEDDPMTFDFRLTPTGLELTMGGVTDAWIRSEQK